MSKSIKQKNSKKLIVKLKNIKKKYAYWNKDFICKITTSCSNCSNTGENCHGDGQCGGDGE